MNLRRAIFTLPACAFPLVLTSCFSGSFGPTPPTLSISPAPASVPAGTSVTFTATTTGNIPSFFWILYDSGPAGTLSSTAARTITYTAPATPPIYAPPYGAAPAGEGIVILTAYVENSQGDDELLEADVFPITAPSVTVGLSPATVSVALGTTEQFSGYAVGNINNSLTWQVNGVSGGSSTYGSITQANTYNDNGGLYTAPATMPMTGPTVTITMISQADPTKTATATITLH